MREKVRTEFGERLFRARKEAKLTQTQLGEKVGLSQGTIGELEWIGQGSSKTPQLAAACGVTAAYLATGKQSTEAAPWPLTGIVEAAKWGELPEDVRADALAAARIPIDRHLQKAGTGKSSPSQDDAKRRSAG